MEFILTAVFIGGFVVFLAQRKQVRRQSHRPQVARPRLNKAPLPPKPRPELPTPAIRQIEGKAYIIDGDSLRINGVEVRLFGVDAPEYHHPYGQKAKWALLKLCKGQIIRADVDSVDGHGRVVARCFLPNGQDLSAEMVKAGLAIDWPKFSKGCYRCHETPDARRKMWLADARQRGQLHLWAQFDAQQAQKHASNGKNG